MSDKTFKVVPGDEIIITVPRKKTPNPPTFARPSTPKGMIRARRNDDFLPRRLRKAIKLKFYDLGQVTFDDAATWIGYNGFFINPSDFIPYYGFGEQLGWYIDQQQETLPQVADYNLPLLGEYSDRRYGREVKQSNNNVYPLNVIGFTGTVEEPEIVFNFSSITPPDNWTDDGLKLTDAELNSKIVFLDTKGYGCSFGVFEGNKITTTNDFNADAVSDFKLAKDAKIYFVPLLHEGIAESKRNVEMLIEQRGTLHTGYKAKPRFFDQPGTLIETNSGDLEVYNRFIAYEETIFGTVIPYLYDAYFNSPVIRGPVKSGLENVGLNEAFNVDDPYFVVRYRPTQPVAGQLVGVIKQNEQLYYFWQL